MNADTLKLTALKTVVTKLMAQNGDQSWSSDITDFVRDLTSMPLDELIRACPRLLMLVDVLLTSL